MKKIIINFFIFSYLFFNFISNSYSEDSNKKDITTLLRNQHLTVFDIGIFRMKNDLENTKSTVNKHFPSDKVNVDHIYTEVLTSFWRDTIDLIVSIPMNKNLKKENYMSDMHRCKNIFFSVRDHLLRKQNESNYNFNRASSYIITTFSTPTSWPSWKYDQNQVKDLISMIQLEVTLRPTKSLALSENVSPIRCRGDLAADNDTLIISKKYN